MCVKKYHALSYFSDIFFQTIHVYYFQNVPSDSLWWQHGIGIMLPVSVSHSDTFPIFQLQSIFWHLMIKLSWERNCFLRMRKELDSVSVEDPKFFYRPSLLHTWLQCRHDCRIFITWGEKKERKCVWLISLLYSLYYHALEPNLHYLWGVPVLQRRKCFVV